MKQLIAPALKALAGAALLALALLPFAPSQAPTFAASGISLSTSVQATFPSSIAFNVKAQGTANITQLRIHYTVERQNFASVVSEGWAQFTPATSVTTQWVWDMRKSPQPPGTKIDYWWTARDATGATAQTDRATVSFDDSRYTWQSITTGPVTLLWYSGSRSFADSLMGAAQQGLQRIEGDVGAMPQGSVRVYIYGSVQDLLGAQLFPPQWEGGVTFPGYDAIAIGVATNQLSFGLTAVPHELTHWIVGQVTFNDYGAGLPTWLDEGLATYGEGQLNQNYALALTNAIDNGQLISVRSLSGPFSAVAAQAYISYGEANSIVTFMITKYGKDKMVQLLHVFQQGAGYDDALKQVYGCDQDGLDSAWRQSLGVKG
jgi:hypothetical protein